MPETAEVAARRADLKPRRDNLGLQQTETLAALAAEPQDGVVAPGKLNLSALQQVLRNDEAYLKMLVIGDTVYAMLIGPADAALWRADIGAAGLDQAVDALRSTIATVEHRRRRTYPLDPATPRPLSPRPSGPCPRPPTPNPPH